MTASSMCETWISNELKECFLPLQESSDIQDVRTDLAGLIAHELGSIKQIERVYARRVNRLFYVWIMVDRSDEKLRSAIYRKQDLIMSELSDHGFDFYFIDRFGQRPEDLISGGVDLIYSR